MKNVMIASPSHNGEVNVWYACALTESAKIGLTKDINIVPIFMSYDSLVQRARNDIIKLAYENKFDALVFIDVDQDWNAEDLFKLLEHDEDVVGCPVRKKTDTELYNIKLTGEYKKLSNGLVEVDSVGTGFLKLSYDAMKLMWDNAEEYSESDGKTGRMVFNVEIRDGELISEDVIFCTKYRELGGKVYIDPTINSAHSGVKRWIGNFEAWIENLYEGQ